MNSGLRSRAAVPRPLFAFLLLLLLSSAGAGVGAQTEGRPQTPSQAAARPGVLLPARASAAGRIVLLRLVDAPAGARVTVASDAPLDDYSTRFEGDNFFLLIPHSRATGAQGRLSGSGFTGALLEQREGDVLLSLRVQAGARMRISKGFNRLELDFSAAPAARAEGDEAGEAISQMRAQIADLEARLRELEARQAQGAGAAAQTAQAAPAPAALAASPAETAAEPAAGPVGHAAAQHDGDHEQTPGGPPRMELQGFADVNFHVSNQKGTTNSFSLGQLDLFMTSRLSEKFSVLGELIVEAGQDNRFSFEIHRLLLRYAPNDYLNLSAGRYHTAIGFYNTAYHHGSWFQTAVNRPFIFAFESKGGILPLHNVGVAATGRIPSGSLGLHYIAEVGNGRASRSRLDAAVQTAVDDNNGKSFNLGLFSRPKSLPGFQTGFSFYRDSLTPAGAPRVGQSIMAGHVVYQNRLYEVLNEAVVVRHEREGRVFYTPGLYTQFSRRFGDLRPYARYQYVNVPGDDPVYPDVGRRNGPSVGLRYDVSEFAAFKAQYDHTQRRRQSPIDELLLQFAFTF
jgi:BMFP domain-containing protein YqiC